MSRTLVVLLVGLASCHTPLSEPPPETRVVVEEPGESLSFVAIGDFGDDSPSEASVAARVKDAAPDVVITLGDNNYPSGERRTIDANIGKHYASFIQPYRGDYGPGGDRNRFFPTLGNHDWRTRDLEPYLEYFELPGNERYYDFVWGPVHFFALDSDPAEPDGVDVDSTQAKWLQAGLASSTAPWQVVYMHHAPFSSGEHGSTRNMQWPYEAWGADLVLAGHDHHYERIERDGTVYLVNGLSGSPKVYDIRTPIEGSVLRFNEAHGALFGTATPTTLSIAFITGDGATIDSVTLEKPGAEHPPAPAPPREPGPADFEAYED